MKTELEQHDIDAIVQKVIEGLKPILVCNNKEEDEILDINEASAFLKTKKGQIYQWVSNSKYGIGNFPYLKAGKQLRFSKKKLIEWLESR